MGHERSRGAGSSARLRRPEAGRGRIGRLIPQVIPVHREGFRAGRAQQTDPSRSRSTAPNEPGSLGAHRRGCPTARTHRPGGSDRRRHGRHEGEGEAGCRLRCSSSKRVATRSRLDTRPKDSRRLSHHGTPRGCRVYGIATQPTRSARCALAGAFSIVSAHGQRAKGAWRVLRRPLGRSRALPETFRGRANTPPTPRTRTQPFP